MLSSGTGQEDERVDTATQKEAGVGRARPQSVGATFAPAIPARTAPAANQVVPADRSHNRHGDPPTEHSIAGVPLSYMGY